MDLCNNIINYKAVKKGSNQSNFFSQIHIFKVDSIYIH